MALLVAATTARVYLGLLAFEAQLKQARDTAVSRAEALRLEEDKLRVGYISQLQFTQAQSEYQAVQQAIPQLQLAISRQHNILRLLTGDLPAARSAMPPSFHGLQVPIPPTVLPSDLLRRRPDIAHAELQLAATDASLAARRASFLPQVSLTGSLSGLFVNALQYNPVTVWSVGGSILAPIFNRDRLRAEFDAVAAQRDAAAFEYRGAALAAFSEVEGALAGQLYFAEQLDHVMQRREVLRQSLEHARNRYEAGYAPYLDQLDAQRNLYQVENEAIAVHQSQLENVVDLYKALGGGWDVTRVSASQTSSTQRTEIARPRPVISGHR